MSMLFGKRGIVSIVGGLALMVAGLIGYFKYDEIVNGFDFFSTGNISHLPFLRTENGKWGMVGIDGSLLFAANLMMTSSNASRNSTFSIPLK